MKDTILKALALLIPPLAIFTGPLFAPGDRAVGQISDALFGDIPLIPAGYAFSIWSVIYLGVLALAIIQILPRWSNHPRIQAARLPLILNMIANFLWIFTWLNLYFVANTLVLFLQLATGVWLYFTLYGPRHRDDAPLSRWLTAPFSLYAAWLTLASVLGATTLRRYLEWQAFGLSDMTWTLIMLLISTALGAFFLRWWRDPFYGAVYVWAFVAIALKPEQLPPVMATALGLSALFLGLIVLEKRRRPTASQVQPSGTLEPRHS